MQRAVIAIVAAAMMAMGANATEEDLQEISPDKLPKFTISIIRSYFPGAKVVTALKEKSKIRNAYDVVLDNGVKCEFDKEGQWTMVDAGDYLIPDRMVPGKIVMYLQRGTFTAPVVKMHKSRKGVYTIILKDGAELHFDSQFRPIA